MLEIGFDSSLLTSSSDLSPAGCASAGTTTVNAKITTRVSNCAARTCVVAVLSAFDCLHEVFAGSMAGWKTPPSSVRKGVHLWPVTGALQRSAPDLLRASAAVLRTQGTKCCAVIAAFDADGVLGALNPTLVRPVQRWLHGLPQNDCSRR